VVVIGALLVLATAACSSSGDEQGSASTTTSAKPRPDGPAATIAGPLTGGTGVAFIGAAAPAGPALDAAGYVEEEYTASGTATSYTAPAGLPTDGTFAFEPADTADYETRLVVRRPADASAFNGTVVVEWLNVSGGVDASAEYTYLQDELLRDGYAWVGVSAQRIGIEGGPIAVEAPGAAEAGAGKGLRAIDPDRYGDLHHPGDAYMYDIYTQVARSLLGTESTDPMGGLPVQQLLATGESQSAFALTTYYDGVQPLTHLFDGFLIHSRGGAPAPIEAPAGYIDIASAVSGKPTQLRTDLDAPVIVVQTESDVLGVLGYYPARQPDSADVRLWEVAGTAHADAFQVGDRENLLDCATPINRGQQVFVLRAAVSALRTWVADGTAPPEAAPLAVDSSTGTPTYVVDDVGNVEGGVRTPAVDAPVDVLSGLAQGTPSVLCLLLGSTLPIPADQLQAKYGSADAYVQQYTAATDAQIAAGFLLEADRAAILEGADPSRLEG
jgi:hypothetical protein